MLPPDQLSALPDRAAGHHYQGSSSTPDPGAYRFSSNVELVLVWKCPAKNSDGGFVFGLDKADFKVFER